MRRRGSAKAWILEIEYPDYAVVTGVGQVTPVGGKRERSAADRVSAQISHSLPAFRIQKQYRAVVDPADAGDSIFAGRELH